jgi:hypothetical protein
LVRWRSPKHVWSQQWWPVVAAWGCSPLFLSVYCGVEKSSMG